MAEIIPERAKVCIHQELIHNVKLIFKSSFATLPFEFDRKTEKPAEDPVKLNKTRTLLYIFVHYALGFNQNCSSPHRRTLLLSKFNATVQSICSLFLFGATLFPILEGKVNG